MSETLPKEWSSKTGIPHEEIVKMFNENAAQLKKMYPSRDQASITRQARYMVYTKIKSRMYTRAKPFDIICLGYNAKRDVTANQRALATQIWNTDREKAVREG